MCIKGAAIQLRGMLQFSLRRNGKNGYSQSNRRSQRQRTFVVVLETGEEIVASLQQLLSPRVGERYSQAYIDGDTDAQRKLVAMI